MNKKDLIDKIAADAEITKAPAGAGLEAVFLEFLEILLKKYSTLTRNQKMPVQYTNRTGKIYYLREGKTKTGKPRYFFSAQQKGIGEAVEEIPETFEIYEHPENAQVFLRKKRLQLITDIEKHLIEQYIKKKKSSKRYRVDYKDELITIYESDSEPDTLKSVFGDLIGNMSLRSGINKEGALNTLVSISDHYYTAMLRFRLIDKEKRKFMAERFCFRGSIDDWIDLEDPGTLKKLCKKYFSLLGTDKFFDTPYL